MDSSTIRYILGLDISLCHTGWALLDLEEKQLTHGLIEPPSGLTDVEKMDFDLNAIRNLPPAGCSNSKLFVVIEGFAFAAKGNSALQLAGIGYLVRHELWKNGIAYKEVSPTLAKKWLTGRGNCDKNIILKEVFKVYKIDVDDDNIADAINLNVIGQALLGVITPSTEIRRKCIEEMNKPPKVKGKKSKKAAQTA